MTTSKIPEPTDIVAPRLLVLRIIVGALVAGLLIMVVLAVVLPPMIAAGNQGAPPPAGEARPLALITIIACVFTAVLLPLSVFLPTRMVASMRKGLAKQSPQADVPALMTLYQTTTIVTAAIREGAGHLAAVAYLVERQPAALGLALVCIVAVGLLFPTRERVERWLENQVDKLTQDREFGDLEPTG